MFSFRIMNNTLIALLLSLLLNSLVLAKPIINNIDGFSLQQQKLGNKFLQLLVNSKQLITDIESIVYLSKLGHTLVGLSEQPNRHFAFYLLSDDSINAFTAPYGYIGMHTGLILKSTHEAEVASVLAHEIAHVVQNHLIRHQEKINKQPYLIAGAILASVLTGSSELSQAIIGTTLASTVQNSISFTRDHEQEADNIGLNILKKSDFNPKGMADFFNKLQDEKDAIEFLRTHPLSVNRITQSLQSIAQNPSNIYRDSFFYQVIKQRLYYARFDRVSAGTNPIVAQYMQAYVLFANEKFAQARQVLNPILDKNNASIVLLNVRILSALGQHKTAIKRINALQHQYPNDEAIAYYQAIILQQAGQVKQASSKLNYFIKTHKVHYPTQDLLAQLYLNNQQLGKHHIAKAFSLVLQGKNKKALFQLERARVNSRDADTRVLIQAYIKQLNIFIELLK